MGEYISREAAVEKITFLCELREILCVPDDEFLRGLKNALDAVKSNEFIPSADVQPVKHGKWEKKKGYLVCSNCGMTVDTIGYTYEEQEEVFRYCSCCGYRMDLKDGDTND